MLGLKRHTVRVVDYDPGWREAYDQIAAQLRAATTGFRVSVEHIGSTSVPGLPAKPIIDVALLLRDNDRFDEFA